MQMTEHVLSLGKAHRIVGPKENDKRLRPADRCIYCFRTEGSDTELTDEHIIPSGLGGDLLFPDASCRDCAAIINPWEQRVIRHTLGAVREREGVKSRSKSERRFNATFGATEDLNAPSRGPQITNPEDLPPAVIYEITKGRPEIIAGPIAENAIEAKASFLNIQDAPPFTLEVRMRGGEYLRLLAKIAHGFAVATVGLESFEPCLIPIILAEDHAVSEFWRYIGWIPAGASYTELHLLQIGLQAVDLRTLAEVQPRPTPFYVVRIHLFARYGTHIHEVVVGRKLVEPKVPSPRPMTATI